MIEFANPRQAPVGRAEWLVGSESGHISDLLVIKRACQHAAVVRVPFQARCLAAIPFPCPGCMEIEL